MVDRGLSTSVVCYFFFKDGQKGQTTAANAMSAVNHQILAHYSDAALMAHSMERFRMHGEKLAEMFSELWANLLQSARDPIPGEIICILDALDECQPDERQQLLNALIEFYSALDSQSNADIRLKFLITSRPDLSIENRLARLSRSISLVHFDADQELNTISRDINRFIEDQVPLVAHRLDEPSQERIMAHLKGMEHRTYLWLHLTFKEIAESAIAGTTEKQLKKFISTLPKSVDEAYENILNRSKEPDMARKLLQCVVVARKTLTVKELNVAFGVWHDRTSYSTLDLEPGDSFRSTLKQICGNFVMVHEEEVYLIHQTEREFLIRLENFQLASTPGKVWQQSIVKEEAEATLAHTCMSVLCFEDFLEEPPYSATPYRFLIMEKNQEWLENRPFFAYCSRFWISHYHSSAEMARPGMLKKIRQLGNPESMYFLNWFPLSGMYVYADISSNLLHISSLLGIDALVIEILNGISDKEAQKSACDGALLFAASAGRRDTMALLLEKGANVDAGDESGDPALHRAAYSENVEAVKLLLEHGANVDALDILGDTALYVACTDETFEIVELLLAYNADFSRGRGNPLFMAAKQGYKDTVRLLFERGARFRKEDWADSKGWDSGLGIVSTDELDIIYELVKDEDPEEYIRILVEELYYKRLGIVSSYAI